MGELPERFSGLDRVAQTVVIRDHGSRRAYVTPGSAGFERVLNLQGDLDAYLRTTSSTRW